MTRKPRPTEEVLAVALSAIKTGVATWRADQYGADQYKHGRYFRLVLAIESAMRQPIENDVIEVEQYDDEKGKALIVRAHEGDQDAAAALRVLAGRHIKVGKIMPPHLAGYVLEVLYPTEFNQRDQGYSTAARDYFVVLVVAMLEAQFGILPTRNSADHDGPPYTSGCSIVAYALGEKEKAVEDVWRDRTRIRQGEARRKHRQNPTRQRKRRLTPAAHSL